MTFQHAMPGANPPANHLSIASAHASASGRTISTPGGSPVPLVSAGLLAASLGGSGARPSTILPDSIIYRCDSCGDVRVYDSSSFFGPSTCSCESGLLSIRRLSLASAAGFLSLQLPSDVGGEILSMPGMDYRFVACPGCPYYDCSAAFAHRTCSLGLRQHTYWLACERRVIRPCNSHCSAAFYQRLLNPESLPQGQGRVG